jgi:hypothetical protein
MRWQPLRLEELLRVAAIVGLATLVGLFSLFLPMLLKLSGGNDPGFGTLFTALLVFTVLWCALPLALAAGLLLHLSLRGWRVPRLLLLAAFVAVAQALVTGLIPASRPADPWGHLHLWIGGSAWLLYVAGPLQLWRFEFDPYRHSDF